MTAQSVLHGIATYLGGAYDTATHTYRSSPISGVGVVRRAAPKSDDHADYYHGMPAGTPSGSQLLVQLGEGAEHRVAVAGASGGYKQVRYECTVYGFIRSSAEYAEDAQDFTYTLLDAIRDRIHADRTCGSGGFESGGFEVGEGDGPTFRWNISSAETKAGLTKLSMLLTFDVIEYIHA